jgi:hypothetical protein
VADFAKASRSGRDSAARSGEEEAAGRGRGGYAAGEKKVADAAAARRAEAAPVAAARREAKRSSRGSPAPRRSTRVAAPQSVDAAPQNWERGGVVTLTTVPPPPTQLMAQGTLFSVTIRGIASARTSGAVGESSSRRWALLERVTEGREDRVAALGAV